MASHVFIRNNVVGIQPFRRAIVARNYCNISFPCGWYRSHPFASSTQRIGGSQYCFFSSNTHSRSNNPPLPVLPKPPLPPAPKEDSKFFPIAAASADATATSSDQPQPRQQRGIIGTFLRRWFQQFNLDLYEKKIIRSESMFQAASRQASDPRWYGPGRIGRDFRPRHAMLTMHVWFLHKRLLADTYDTDTALSMDEEFFHIFWDDTTSRIRKAGVSEMAVNKMLMQVQQYTFLHLTHYDHIYTEFLDQPEERLRELRNLVAHHIFVRDPQYEHRTDHLDRIAWYIDMNYRNIMLEWPDEYYRDARVQWVDCPDFHNIRDEHGHILPNIPVDPEDLLPTPWLRNITRRGDEYYWNPVTMESSWTRPTVGS